ncbi:VWA domain-containing protein [Kaistia dalseonensis]|uniref:Ca-activated chloride channel family protein n=1 Tax=Kaistia dalseonensis TaxID=410840 RepID=A0ABU0HCQ7_9HYPH|nr:VWA domain-containing protein [Kaistia dalseonensis]MCX5497465.1 VWA domain-containing protein [Kaistia dalseonensis]MDQ0440104.1 Ca-activated chloride channel family protein [Kaistia dalseonensis]
MISRLLTPVLAAFIGLAIAAPAMADDAMLVLDASASMGGKLGRDRKIDLVSDAVLAAVADFPTEARIGLLAFGNKSKTSCSDAEVLVRPQQNGNDLVAAAAASLQPRGKAPLAVALERAANALDYQKERATIVLFVDKVEACDADPCVLAQSLKSRARDLTIEVMGLGLDDSEIPAVACIAEKTGGKFVNVKDSTDLAGGLAAALASAKAPPPNLPSASIDAPATVTQSTVFEVGYDGPKSKGDRIQIVWPGLPAGSEIRSVLVAKDGKHRQLISPSEAGTYEIRYYHPELNAVLSSRTLEVTTKPVSVMAPDHIAAGAPLSVSWSGPAAPFDELQIVPVDGLGTTKIASATVNKSGQPILFDAPIQAGTYEIRYHQAADDQIGASARITVDPPSATLRAPATATAGSRIAVEWTGPAARFDDIAVAKAGSAPADWLTNARVRPDRGQVSIAVPQQPGQYELRYIAGDGAAIFAAIPLTVQ